MFYNCDGLTTLDVSGWDTSNISDMGYMFRTCNNITSITGLNNWNTSHVVNMAYMFEDCLQMTSLAVNNWDVSHVVDMQYMFENMDNMSTHNLSGWNTSSCRNFSHMFSSNAILTSVTGADGFNIEKATTVTNMFNGAALATAQWSAILTNFNNQNPKNNLDIHAGTSTYNSAGATARAGLIANDNWTITDGGAAA